jgi:DNA modification methylase
MPKRSTSIHSEIANRARRRRDIARELSAAAPLRAPRNDLRPALQIVNWPIGKLTPPKVAVRKLLPAQVERVKTSMQSFGVVEPLLIRGDGEIVKGRTRFEAARQLGLEDLPCIVVDHLKDPEIRALRIALGRLAEQGEWDFAALKLEIEDLITLDAPVEAIGFAIPEIDALILPDDPDRDIDAVPSLSADQPAVTTLGQIWRLGAHRILCGDAQDPAAYQAVAGEDLARLVFTDPPYNVRISGHVTSGDHREFAMATGEMTQEEFAAFHTAWMGACLGGLAPGGLLAGFMDWRSVELVLAAGRGLGLELLNIVVWAKTNGGMGSLWRSRHELLPVFKRPGEKHTNNVVLGKHGRWRSNVWEYPGASALGSDAREGLAAHPTVKPVALIEDALLDVTNPEDLVLDPFAGSGSTLIACETTGRRCGAIEIDPHYVDVVVRRWQALTGDQAVCGATGARFDDQHAAQF